MKDPCWDDTGQYRCTSAAFASWKCQVGMTWVTGKPGIRVAWVYVWLRYFL